MTHPIRHAAALVAAALLLAACGEEPTTTSTGGAPAVQPPAPARTVTIGLVAKAQSNPVFQAGYAGARAAAKELGPEYGVKIVIDWQTPPNENAVAQARNIEQLARGGADGIAVSCSNADTLTSAIDKAVDLGSVVICFDSDAPKSKRFAFFGTNDIDCGNRVMRELAAAMGQKGRVAILAGNQAAPNLQKRKEGVLQVLKELPEMSLVEDGVIYHNENPQESAQAVNAAQSTSNPPIEGWAMIGGWPLFTRNALKWDPGTVKVVSVDALPDQLDYVDSGHVEVLLAQNCHAWGYESVRILLEKIVNGKDPENADEQGRVYDPLTRITTENAGEFRAKWDAWLGR